MGLKKGQTNNPNGRPKGVPNKATSDLRSAVNKLLDDNWPLIQRDLKKLDPKDRLNFIEKLLSYSLPKLTSSTTELSIKNKLETLSDEQLMAMAEKITELEDEQ